MFHRKKNEIDNSISEPKPMNIQFFNQNPSITLAELPSITKNDTDYRNHNSTHSTNILSVLNMSDHSAKIVKINDIENYVHNSEIDDLKKKVSKTPWLSLSTYIFS